MRRPIVPCLIGVVVGLLATMGSSVAPVAATTGSPTFSATAWPGDASAFVRWSAPATGAPITGFLVTATVAGSSLPSTRVSATARTLTVTGLHNGQTAQFRVVAVDGPGAGRVAETATVVIGRAPLAASASWLDVLNYVRQSSREGLVTANAQWVTQLAAHERYLANTPASVRTGLYASAHTENPASAWFTAAGRTAGASADLLSGDLGSPRANINAWLSSPFHAIGLIRPALRTSAYAAGSGIAGIDVIRGIDTTPPTATHATLLPGPGAITTLRAYSGAERPSPLESCPGFSSPGLPIVVLLPTPAPAGPTASLRQPDGTTLQGHDLCVITARNFVTSDTIYGASGRAVLADSNAVLVIPRTPLHTGRQTVTLTPNGTPPIHWSFSVTA